jgi:DNA-binding transcriptional MocR family regulator
VVSSRVRLKSRTAFEYRCGHFCSAAASGTMRRGAHLQGDAVLESAIAELLDDGLIQRHIRKMRRVYQRRLEILGSALRHFGDFLTFRVPSGELQSG